jgi:hypothetical protein
MNASRRLEEQHFPVEWFAGGSGERRLQQSPPGLSRLFIVFCTSLVEVERCQKPLNHPGWRGGGMYNPKPNAVWKSRMGHAELSNCETHFSTVQATSAASNRNFNSEA